MLFFAVAVVLLARPAAAQQFDLPPGKWWDDARLSERIGLSDAQHGAIEELVYEHARRMIDLKAAVDRAGLDLAAAARREEFEEDAVRDAYRAFRSARGKLEDERFEMLVAVRRVLTAEQWSSLQELRRRAPQGRQSPDGGGRRPGGSPPGLR
jgi:Spy/CpxP family protein refolding chaperone